MINRTTLLEKKVLLQEQYCEALETQNSFRVNFIRGKLSLLDEILKETKEE